MWFKSIADILKDEYGQWYKFKTKELKYCTVKLASIFDGSIKMILPMWRKKILLENEKSRQILGIVYRSTKDTILEMAQALIIHGQVPDKKAAKEKKAANK